MIPPCAAPHLGHKQGGTSPSILLRSVIILMISPCSGFWVGVQTTSPDLPARIGCIYSVCLHRPADAFVEVARATQPKCGAARATEPMCGMALDTVRWLHVFLSSHRFSRTTNVQGFHTLLCPHISSIGNCFPIHTHRYLQVLLTQADTEEVGCFICH